MIHHATRSRWSLRRLQFLAAVGVLAVMPLLRQWLPLTSPQPAATDWTIQTVHDGDTVTAIGPDGRTEKVRLLGIDAPEYRQPHGREARAALAEKLRGRSVRLESRGRDRYDRLLAVLRVGDRNLNEELVAEGHAWVFDRFRPPAGLAAAQQAARRERRGLWAAADPLRPADWREAHPRQR